MASKTDEKWMASNEALKAYIFEQGHLPDKHVVTNRSLLSWAKYQRKKIKEGTLDAEKRELFESLTRHEVKRTYWGKEKEKIEGIY